MARWQVLIYDGNDGQLAAGLGPWERLGEWKKEALLAQDPDAAAKVKGLDDFFRELDVEVREVASYEECLERIAEADVLVLVKGTVDQALLDRAEKLRAVHMLGADTRAVDADALAKKGVALCQTPFTNFLAVAEHNLALLLAVVKRLDESRRLIERGAGWMVLPGNMRLVGEMTVGVLGVGEIGHAFGRLLKPWGAKLLYHDLERSPRFEEETGAEFVSWEALFREADAVSVHLPLNERTEGIIGERELAWMKRDAILLNTARGPLVDEAALVRALQEGEIGGAGLDVFVQEPLPQDHALLELPNVVLTPHSSWAGPWTLVNDAHRLLEGVAERIGQWSGDTANFFPEKGRVL